MRTRRVQAAWGIAIVALAGAACSERHAVTDPVSESAEAITIGARPAGPSIDQVAWTGELVIDGAPVAVSVTVSNPGKTNLGNTSVALRVTQGGSFREVGSSLVTCPNAAPGVLLAGATCTVQVEAVIASTGGTGTIAAGAADLTTVLAQKRKVLASITEGVTLTEAPPPAPPTITDLQLAASTFEIEGAPVGYTVQIANPGGALSIVVLQARMVQGETDRAAGGTQVLCPGETGGVLPAGGCTFDFEASAMNLAGGTGVLVPGEATLVFDLYHGNTLLDSWSETVTLAADDPYIAGVTLSSYDFVLGGSSELATFTLYNPTGAVIDPVNILLWVRQGTAQRSPGVVDIFCGDHPDELPPGICVEQQSIAVWNGQPGDGELVTGPAILEVTLRNTSSNVLHVVNIPINLH